MGPGEGERRSRRTGGESTYHIGRLMLAPIVIATLALPMILTSRVRAARLSVSRPWTIRQTLSFCAAHPRMRDRASSVRGYYFAFQPGRGSAAFGELLSSPAQVRDVLRADSVPGKIGFGILIATPLLGLHPGREGPPRSRSWITLTGLLSCYEGTPLADLLVRRYRYG